MDESHLWSQHIGDVGEGRALGPGPHGAGLVNPRGPQCLHIHCRGRCRWRFHVDSCRTPPDDDLARVVSANLCMQTSCLQVRHWSNLQHIRAHASMKSWVYGDKRKL